MSSTTLYKNEFGIPSKMYNGLCQNALDISNTAVSSSITLDRPLDKEGEEFCNYVHPVQKVLDRVGPKFDELERLRAIAASQGLHAPLKLAMERKIMDSLHPRLPGFHAYHPLAAQLRGDLDEIDFSDLLDNSYDAESVGDPHLLMEKKLGILGDKRSNVTRMGIPIDEL